MAVHYPELRRRAKNLRKNPTRTEQILWGKLRKRQILGYKFRRQHILPPHIVDFYCVPAKLAIEIDGAVHAEFRQAQLDQDRTHDLHRVHDVGLIRFTNFQVRRRLQRVLRTIADQLRGSSSSA